jgi:vacuolar-type H+-ATPase subunit F/Vma7
MSRLFIITRPALVPGFQLAGVDAYGATDVETAQELITSWLDRGETGLLAIDDGLLMKMDPVIIKNLQTYEHLPFLSIPSGQPLGPEASRRHQLAESIRRAIGFHITFKGEETEASDR